MESSFRHLVSLRLVLFIRITPSGLNVRYWKRSTAGRPVKLGNYTNWVPPPPIKGQDCPQLKISNKCCENMEFDLVSFLPTDYQAELGLIVHVIRYLYLGVQSGRNIVWLHLFPDHAHVLIALPFIPVILTDYLGSFRCLRTDAYRGKNGYWFLTEYSIFIQEEFIASCLERNLFPKAPLDWCLGNLFFVVTRPFSYLFL